MRIEQQDTQKFRAIRYFQFVSFSLRIPLSLFFYGEANLFLASLLFSECEDSHLAAPFN